jgi:hypothetical protein
MPFIKEQFFETADSLECSRRITREIITFGLFELVGSLEVNKTEANEALCGASYGMHHSLQYSEPRTTA